MTDHHYDDYLRTLSKVRNKATILNAALGDGAPGLFVHWAATELLEAAQELHDKWDPEYAQYAPRVTTDPLTEKFLDALSRRFEIPDTIGDIDADTNQNPTDDQ